MPPAQNQPEEEHLDEWFARRLESQGIPSRFGAPSLSRMTALAALVVALGGLLWALSSVGPKSSANAPTTNPPTQGGGHTGTTGSTSTPFHTGNAAWLTALVREYPNVLVIDVGEILRQVQSIMDQVARAVEFVFLFTLAGGVLVLEAAIAATQDERRYDAAVLRTLGASERQLTAAQVAEFLALGALAGLVAAAGATAIGYALADRVFQIPFGWNPALWLIGIVGAAACIAVAGWLGTRSTLRQPPLAALREST